MESIVSVFSIVNILTEKNLRKNIWSYRKVKSPIEPRLAQNRCPKDVNSFYVSYPFKKQIVEYHKTTGEQKYNEFLEDFSYGQITDKLLKDFGKKWTSQNCILTLKNPDNTPFSFLCMKKGNERYNTIYNHKTVDLCGAMVEMGLEIVAMTLTYDIKKHGENRFYAWKNYPKHISNWLENLRKHKDCVFVRVTESTKKGYPHSHIVVGFPKGTIPNYDKMGNREKITSGWLYDYSQRFVDSKVFNLEKVSGDNTRFYLSKYISKTSNQDLQKICNKKGSLTESERKTILGLMGTVITDTRTVSYTQPKTMLKRATNPNEECIKLLSNWCNITSEEIKHVNEKSVTTVPDMPQKTFDYEFIMSDDFTEERANYFRRYLITLCNNSPLNCMRDIHINKKSVWEEKLNRPFNGHEVLNATDYEKIHSNNRNYGCSGCLFAHLQHLILTGYDVDLDFKMLNADGNIINLFDKSINENNVIFIRNLTRVINYLVEMMLWHGWSFDEVIKNTLFINSKNKYRGNPL